MFENAWDCEIQNTVDKNHKTAEVDRPLGISQGTLPSFYSLSIWDSEMAYDLPKVTQQMGGQSGLKSRQDGYKHQFFESATPVFKSSLTYLWAGFLSGVPIQVVHTIL